MTDCCVGAGKSLCFQIPALLLNGVSVCIFSNNVRPNTLQFVVSPLVALMVSLFSILLLELMNLHSKIKSLHCRGGE